MLVGWESRRRTLQRGPKHLFFMWSWGTFPMRSLYLFAVAFLGLSSATLLPAAELKFEAVTIDPEPGKVVYALTVVDLNGNGRNDIVAITEDKVIWYAAPEWEKHVLLEGTTQPDNVCVAAFDINGDLRMDLAIGAGWPRNGGTIQWLQQGKKTTDPWTLHPIAAIPWTHRMQFANVLGTKDQLGNPGKPQLIVSPLNAVEGQAGVALTAFSIPDDPVNDRWPSTVINQEFNRMHNHLCVRSSGLPWPGSYGEQTLTLTASQEGVHVIYRDTDSARNADASAAELRNSMFMRDRLVEGTLGESPAESGAGEVKVGGLADGSYFIATIEPMHGTDAVVYRMDRRASHITERVVLTDQLRGGHALWVADIDKDGDDEVIVGWREPNPEVGIAIFDRKFDGSWKQQTLDLGGVACEDLVVSDLSANGNLDIVAGGRATHNIKLYINHGRAR